MLQIFATNADELRPVQSGFIYHTPQYHVNLRKVLFGPIRHQKNVQFLYQPSFTPETLLSVDRKDYQSYDLIIKTTKRGLWRFKGNADKVKVIEHRKTLSVELVERIRAVWQTMLLRTRHLPFGHDHRQIVHQGKSKFRYISTRDGVGAVFMHFVESYGVLSGRTSNPLKDTKPEIMMRLGKTMIDYVLAPKAEEDGLQSKIVALTHRLEQLLANDKSGWQPPQFNCDTAEEAALIAMRYIATAQVDANQCDCDGVAANKFQHWLGRHHKEIAALDFYYRQAPRLKAKFEETIDAAKQRWSTDKNRKNNCLGNANSFARQADFEPNETHQCHYYNILDRSIFK
ncbi:MAG: hypothetical protein MJK04_16360 [Psychrosphaera sp.]|nr:hypothetical protein [Psychrosphaera sp.]